MSNETKYTIWTALSQDRNQMFYGVIQEDKGININEALNGRLIDSIYRGQIEFQIDNLAIIDEEKIVLVSHKGMRHECGFISSGEQEKCERDIYIWTEKNNKTLSWSDGLEIKSRDMIDFKIIKEHTIYDYTVDYNGKITTHDEAKLAIGGFRSVIQHISLIKLAKHIKEVESNQIFSTKTNFSNLTTQFEQIKGVLSLEELHQTNELLNEVRMLFENALNKTKVERERQ